MVIEIQTKTTNRLSKKDIIKLVETNLNLRIDDPILSREGLKWTTDKKYEEKK